MKNVIYLLVIAFLIVAMIIQLVRYVGADEGNRNTKDLWVIVTLSISALAILLRRMSN